MILNRIVYFWVCLVVFWSCAVEQNIPIEGDFSVSMVNDNHNVPARIRITNQVKGADTFLWEFPQGNYTSSDLPHPEEVIYNQVGTHTITLHASNMDGEKKTFEKNFTLFAELTSLFEWEQVGSSYAPLTLTMKNRSQGAQAYQWHFEGGTPEYSSEESPQVVFQNGGNFKITLETINHSQRQKSEQVISVNPPLKVAFDLQNEYAHNWQAPVRIFLTNKTENATLGYHWRVTNGTFSQESTDEHPNFLLPQSGEYQVILTAKNDKQTLSLEKKIIVEQGQNLLTFTNIKLGINTAQHTIGCFFSSYLGKTLTFDQITSEMGKQIDWVYFGQNASFTYNLFLSPNKAETAVFDQIPNATNTIFINKQENTGQTFLDADAFDNLLSGNDFATINIKNNQNQAPFSNQLTPRIVLFQTADGRKGAIKIKEYVNAGTQSYILVDIKIQKIP